MVVGAVLVVSLSIGCSSGRHQFATPTTKAPTTMTPTVATTSSSGSPPTSVSPTPTSTVGSVAAAAAGPLRCKPASLNATVTDQGGAVGHGGEVVVLRLVAGVPCTLYGYPGLGLKGPAGQTFPLTVVRQTQAGFLLPYVNPAQVLLSAVAPASFGIEWINMFNPTATTLVVTVTAVTTGQLQGPSQNG